MVPVFDQVIGLLKEGVVLWRVYLDKKVDLYELHLKKKRLNAIKIANQMDEVVDEMIIFVNSKIPLDDNAWEEFHKLKKKYNALDKKFDNLG